MKKKPRGTSKKAFFNMFASRGLSKLQIILIAFAGIVIASLGVTIIGAKKAVQETHTVQPTPQITSSPSPSPTIIVTSTPSVFVPTRQVPVMTATPTFVPNSIQSINPIYLPEDYSGSNKIKITGSGFQSNATVVLEGPYLSGVKAANFNDYPLQSVLITPPNYIDGTIASGLPGGYFLVIVRNPDGSIIKSGSSLLHQGSGKVQ